MPRDDLVFAQVFADSIDAKDRSIVLSKDSPDRDRSDRRARRCGRSRRRLRHPTHIPATNGDASPI
jgi:hypothetical protein